MTSQELLESIHQDLSVALGHTAAITRELVGISEALASLAVAFPCLCEHLGSKPDAPLTPPAPPKK